MTKPAIALDDKFIDDLTEDVVNFLALKVQDTLGVESGDVAGVHFSDFSDEGPKAQIAKIIRDYIAIEEMYLANEQDDDSPYVMEQDDPFAQKHLPSND